MTTQEHSVITFLKSHGKEILSKERNKYEPIKKKDQQIIAKPQLDEVERLKTEISRLKINTNMEWLNKYKFYKNKYKVQKKELKLTKLEIITVKEEIVTIQEEMNYLKLELQRIKGKDKIETLHSNSEKEESEQIDSSETEEEAKMINYIEESEENIVNENKEILLTLEKMKNVNAMIEEDQSNKDHSNTDHSDIEEDKPSDTEIESEEIITDDVDDYPEREITDQIITRKHNKFPDHIPIGQHNEFQDFIGSVTQGINTNGYFLDLDNVYDEQEISRRIKDWNLGMYIALMNSKNTEDLDYVYELISKTIIGKAAFWIESIAYELKGEAFHNAQTWRDMLNIFDVVLKREFLGERWFVAQDSIMAERKIEIVMNLNNMRCCKINKLPEYTISFTKFFYEARFLPQENLIYQQLYYDHLPSPYNTEVSKEYANLEPKENTLGERIRMLRVYLMRKCEEYRIQQKIKKDKKKGLKEVCGFTERKIIFGCDNKERKNKKYKKPYKKHNYKKNNQHKYYKPNRPYYNRFRRKRFRRYNNTPENRKRFRFKRKFRRRRYVKPTEENNNKPSDCRCWNCNEKGHYANKCPQLKQKGIKYIDNTEFIMNLEYIKEEHSTWHNDKEFYISETETEEDIYTSNKESE